MKIRIYFDNKPQVQNGRLVSIPQTIVTKSLRAPATDSEVNAAVTKASAARGCQLPARYEFI